MTLTAQQLQERDGKLTASRVSVLMTGDEVKILNLWLEMIGDPSFVPEDLSGVWAIRLGETTEALNLAWYAKKLARTLTRQGEVIVHPTVEWAAATLDAWDPELPGPVEAKHCGGREPLETIVARYAPQTHWQMIVTGAKVCALSVIMGANEPVVEMLPYDRDYGLELFERAKQFMRCVETLTPPAALPAVAAPIRPEAVYDFTGKNNWSAEAATWLETREASKRCLAAEKAIKALVPADAARCHGHGVECKRDRAGRLSLRSSLA